jgi:hypothetical protein
MIRFISIVFLGGARSQRAVSRLSRHRFFPKCAVRRQVCRRGAQSACATDFLSRRPKRLLKKLFSLPLADARGSVTAAEAALPFPNRDRRPTNQMKTLIADVGRGFGPAAGLSPGTERYASRGESVFRGAAGSLFLKPVKAGSCLGK